MLNDCKYLLEGSKCGISEDNIYCDEVGACVSYESKKVDYKHNYESLVNFINVMAALTENALKAYEGMNAVNLTNIAHAELRAYQGLQTLIQTMGGHNDDNNQD